MEFNSKDFLKYKDNKWIAIEGKVYDVSKFVEQHPGGSEVIEEWYGKDATEAFLYIHPSGEKKLTDTWGEDKDSYYKGVFSKSNDLSETPLNRTTRTVLLFLCISFIGWLLGHYIMFIIFSVASIEICYNFLELPEIWKIKVKTDNCLITQNGETLSSN